ncbi:MAG TPA: S8 family serine peptidase [Draconibacterium sp.]|nr:S8 family serine peptidase [Draconibacterium sp.]
MKKLLFKLVALVFVLALANACNDSLVNEEAINDLELKSASLKKESYIVVLQDADLNQELVKLKGYEKKQNAVKAVSEKILKRAGISDGELGYMYGTALKGFSVKIPPGQLNKLQNDPSVKYVEKDQIISLITPYAKPGAITTEAAQVIPPGITRVNGGSTYTGSKVVWVIDTGIDLTHEDLNVDASRGTTFITTVTTPDDDNGHGSHCAGIIGALDNSVGVVGVAAGVTLIPVKVLDKRGSGSTTGVIAGVDFVAANGAPGDVANMSLGGSVYAPLDEAIYNASLTGIKFALAAGNESDDANNHSPARVNGTNIYTISAMDVNDVFAYFSNYGNPPVDYCEPGVSIYSTYKDGGYATLSGTSMATPHMAGILVWGAPVTDGYVINDPDGNADPIGVATSGGTVDPVNHAPVASFTTSINELSVIFTNTSTDPDGDAVSIVSWNFGDGTTSTLSGPSHTYAAAGTYNVSLTVTDGALQASTTKPVTVTSTPPVGDIALTAVMRKVRGTRYVDLSWTGANGSSVSVKVNGADYTTTANDGAETLNMARSSGTFTFQVCETDGSACSNIVTLVL